MKKQRQGWGYQQRQLERAAGSGRAPRPAAAAKAMEVPARPAAAFAAGVAAAAAPSLPPSSLAPSKRKSTPEQLRLLLPLPAAPAQNNRPRPHLQRLIRVVAQPSGQSGHFPPGSSSLYFQAPPLTSPAVPHQGSGSTAQRPTRPLALRQSQTMFLSPPLQLLMQRHVRVAAQPSGQPSHLPSGSPSPRSPAPPFNFSCSAT